MSSEDAVGLDINEQPDVEAGVSRDEAWTSYPIDELLIRNESRTVHDVLRRIDQGQFVMYPDFQRDLVWRRDKQSRLIESMMMRIPLPVFYLAEDQEGRMVVVDGLQRLSTFHDFVGNKFRLALPDREDLHGKQFRDLAPIHQNRIEDCNLILYIIDSKVPERARLDIFERVNGGEPLTRQQMRNSLYNGQATRWLKKEAGQDIFIQATGNSLRPRTMRDREFVNRFCAWELLSMGDIPDYPGHMDDFLASALSAMNRFIPSDFTRRFRRSMRNNFHVFGEHAFRKISIDRAGRSVINAAIWDVMSTGLARYSEGRVESRAEVLNGAFYGLMEDKDFWGSITYGTNSDNMVNIRFTAVNQMLYEVFGA